MFSIQRCQSARFIGSALTLVLAGCSSSSTSPSSTPDALEVLAGTTQNSWSISSRVENGAPAGLPACAKDDLLIFKRSGKFDSLIGATPCNPSETEVRDGSFTLSADRQVITFDVPGFGYTGKLLEYSKERLVIEFDLGQGFVIKDTFEPKK
jgi:hypothetical protein